MKCLIAALILWPSLVLAQNVLPPIIPQNGTNLLPLNNTFTGNNNFTGQTTFGLNPIFSACPLYDQILGGGSSPVECGPQYSFTVPGIPAYAPATNGYGLPNSSFAINYSASTSITNSTAFQVDRTDTWTGGGFGNVTPAAYFNMVSPAGRTAFSWTGVFDMENYGTAADLSQNVALYAISRNYGGGGTWGGTIQTIDESGNSNPTISQIALEIDNNANGTDANYQRAGIQAVMINQNNQSAPAYGLAAYKTLTTGNAFWIWGLWCGTNTISSGCVGMVDNQAIDFADTSGGRTLLHNINAWYFQDHSTGTNPLIISDTGTVTALAGFATGSSTGVSCSGSPTSSFASVGGIVTHC